MISQLKPAEIKYKTYVRTKITSIVCTKKPNQIKHMARQTTIWVCPEKMSCSVLSKIGLTSHEIRRDRKDKHLRLDRVNKSLKFLTKGVLDWELYTV